ncbi:MAG: glycosyltransferase [Rickettsiaceae bacterium]|nr:glycosyltransferase [Rickettsiaceae bacterium]
MLIIFPDLSKVISKEIHRHNEAEKSKQRKQLIDLASKIPTETWDLKYQNMPIKEKYKVVFIVAALGESSYAEHFKYGAELMGWEVKLYINYPVSREDEILAFDPDMIITVPHSTYTNSPKLSSHRSKKYIINFMGYNYLENHPDKFLPFHAVMTALPSVDLFAQLFKKQNKPFNGFRILPSVPGDRFTHTAEPINIMWSGTNWDTLRASDKYNEFLTLLSTNLPIKIYGPYNAYSFLREGVYNGFIAPGPENLRAMRDNGIYLAVHGDHHYEDDTPSIRLLEALAANVIVITDKLPFIIKNFGEDVLYFDNKLEPEAMYQEIRKHFEWIKNNPEKAKEKAANAHKKYLAKFSFEQYLTKIAKMHEYILMQEKEMKIKYPLGYF